MDRYYYLMAQLPALRIEQDAVPTVAHVLQEARKWISCRHYHWLSRLKVDDDLPSAGDPEPVRCYKDFETALRRELAQWRLARRQGQAYRPLLFSAHLLEEGNPLEVEKKLMRLRWDVVEDLAVGHHFDLEALAFYYLQLQMLHRLAAFEAEKGLAVFRSLCEVAL